MSDSLPRIQIGEATISAVPATSVLPQTAEETERFWAQMRRFNAELIAGVLNQSSATLVEKEAYLKTLKGSLQKEEHEAP